MNIFLKIKKRFFNKKYKKSEITIMENSIMDNATSIGKYTYIGYYCLITKAKIGRYVSIASNVSIGGGEHDIKRVSTNSIFYESAKKILLEKDCVIGNDVWVGVGSIIRRGVSIGNGAVIGANSFVNSDIPPYAIAVGSPAKIIKYRFTPDQIKIIEDSRWWEKDLDEARKIISRLELQFGIQ